MTDSSPGFHPWEEGISQQRSAVGTTRIEQQEQLQFLNFRATQRTEEPSVRPGSLMYVFELLKLRRHALVALLAENDQ